MTKSFYDFARWSSKQLGPKPTLEQQAIAHAFGKPGKQTLSLAMRLRDGGATANQCTDAVEAVWGVGKTQNVMPQKMVAAGFFKREVMPAQPVTGHTVYKYTLAPKGQAHIDRVPVYGQAKAVEAEPAKPVKVKAKAKKARKAKVTTPVEMPVEAIEAVTEAVIEPVEAQLAAE